VKSSECYTTDRVVGGFFKGDEISVSMNKKEILNRTYDV
jgi:hypothetical protein